MIRNQSRYLISLVLVTLALAGCASSPAATNEAQPSTTTPTSSTATSAANNTPTTTEAPLPTETAIPPAPTATPTIVAQPTLPTAPPLAVTPIADTLVLYTLAVPGQLTPDQPVDTYWAFRTLPALPGLDQAVFDTFYGPYEDMEPGRFFFNFRPQLSPDGRYILVAGLVSYPQYNVEGTGTWLIDLQT